MQSIDQEGKTVDEALQKALVFLEKTLEDVDYEVLDEGSKGVLGVGARPTLVRVRVKEIEEVISARNLLSTFLTDLEISYNSLEISVNKNNVIKIDIDTEEDAGILIGKHGQTLLSLQYLVNQIMHDAKFKFMIDISSYKEKQNAKLVEIVKKISGTVRKTKRRITLKPMTSFERRLVHETVKDFPDLFTKSIGVEPNRRVVISLVNPPAYSETEEEQPQRKYYPRPNRDYNNRDYNKDPNRDPNKEGTSSTGNTYRKPTGTRFNSNFSQQKPYSQRFNNTKKPL